MFCPYCGAKLVDNASFCMTCGKQIASPTQQPVVQAPEISQQQFQAQRKELRISEISALENAITHFSRKNDRYMEYDRVCERLNYYAEGASSALLIWGCIIATFMMFLFLALVGNDVRVNETIQYVMLATFAVGLMMIIGGILMKVNNRKKFAYYENLYIQLSMELRSHYVAYQGCPVPPEYTNPDVMRLFLEELKTGRADTISDAVKNLVEGRRRSRIQDYIEKLQESTEDISPDCRATTYYVAASLFR